MSDFIKYSTDPNKECTTDTATKLVELIDGSKDYDPSNVLKAINKCEIAATAEEKRKIKDFKNKSKEVKKSSDKADLQNLQQNLRLIAKGTYPIKTKDKTPEAQQAKIDEMSEIVAKGIGSSEHYAADQYLKKITRISNSVSSLTEKVLEEKNKLDPGPKNLEDFRQGLEKLKPNEIEELTILKKGRLYGTEYTQLFENLKEIFKDRKLSSVADFGLFAKSTGDGSIINGFSNYKVFETVYQVLNNSKKRSRVDPGTEEGIKLREKDEIKELVDKIIKGNETIPNLDKLKKLKSETDYAPNKDILEKLIKLKSIKEQEYDFLKDNQKLIQTGINEIIANLPDPIKDKNRDLISGVQKKQRELLSIFTDIRNNKTNNTTPIGDPIYEELNDLLVNARLNKMLAITEINKKNDIVEKLQAAARAEAKKAKAELTEAVNRRDVSLLKTAIPAAEAAGVDASDVTVAKTLLAELEAKTTAPGKNPAEELAEAVKGSDIDGLKKAIDAAEAAGVEDVKLNAARKKLAELELEEAMKGSDVGRLKKAIPAAEEAGVEDVKLNAARKKLAELELEEAVKGSDIGRLKKAIPAAVAAGVDASKVEEARKRQKDLEAKTSAPGKNPAEELAEAVKGSDVGRLNTAITAAEAASVDASQVAAAKARLVELELAEAVKGSDIGRLKKAIPAAVAAGVDASKVEEARKRQKDLLYAKADADAAAARRKARVRTPIRRGDMPPLAEGGSKKRLRKKDKKKTKKYKSKNKSKNRSKKHNRKSKRCTNKKKTKTLHKKHRNRSIHKRRFKNNKITRHRHKNKYR